MATQKYEVSCCAVSKIQGINAIGSKFCAFCTLPLNRVIDESATAIAIRDGYPVSPGHTLLIPRRHAGSFFDLSAKEHLHVHLIPRFEGDLPDPRGGVRWVIPDKAKYWA